MTSFVSEFERAGVIVCAIELALANDLSKEPDLFEISRTPGADQQV